MKKVFLKQIINEPELYTEITSIYVWLVKKRKLGKIMFLDVCDSTGKLQTTADKQLLPINKFQSLSKTPLESCIKLEVKLYKELDNKWAAKIYDFEVIGEMKLDISPLPRSNFDIFSSKGTDHFLKNRHLYIRNPKVMAILKYRHLMMGDVHRWFRNNGYIEITAPVLTRLPLYNDGSAISLDIHGEKAYLTQCVGFYLESAVAAFEKVYNIGPSFRGEESRSKRHLMEYWHIKAETAFMNLEEGRGIIEHLIQYLLQNLYNNPEYDEILKTLGTTPAMDGLEIPYPTISYREAVRLLNKSGYKFAFGKSLSSIEESILSEKFDRPFWIVGIPRSLEPFPYTIDETDPEITRVSDLIASRGYGELLGVGEKIYDSVHIKERMKEKGQWEKPEYSWVKDLRSSGFFPHVGFGMGVERFIRWALRIQHVRDAIPFPRIFRRNIYP